MRYTWPELKWWMQQVANVRARAERVQFDLFRAALWGSGEPTTQPTDNQE